MDPATTQKVDRTEFIKGAVAKLQYFAQLYGVDSLFIVGGYCRCLYFDKLADVNDIDVASAYEHQAIQLAGLFGSEVIGSAPEIYERTQTAMVEYKVDKQSIKIEFQGKSTNPYMYNQEIRDWSHNNEIEDIPLMHNIYGRDFTINALIYSLINEQVYDPTNLGFKDLESGIIKSLLPPAFLIKYNPIAALRAIRFAMYYNFKIDDELQEQMRRSYPLLKASLSEDRITKEVLRILKMDGQEAIRQLKMYDLDKLLLLPLLRKQISS